MSLPGNITTVVLTGKYLDFQGLPVEGDVLISWPGFVRDPGANVILVPLEIRVTLDASGAFSIALPSSDDPDLTPTGFECTVQEKFPNGRKYSFPLPGASVTLDLADIAPDFAAPDPGETVYASFPALEAEIANRIAGDLGLVEEANAYTDAQVATRVPLDTANDPNGYAALDSNAKILGAQIQFPTSGTPAGPGAAANGALGTPARSDHVHPRDGDLVSRMGVAETDITTAEGAITAAEGDITVLEAADLQNVKLTGAQTVAGVKTFSSIPVGPASDPTTANQLARKSYVDTSVATAVLLAGAQTVAGVKTFSSIPVLPASDPTTGNEATRKSYVDAGDATAVKLTTAQTVAGVKTFSSVPVLPAADPTASNEATRKLYVDTMDLTVYNSAVLLTTAQTVAGVKTFSSIPVLPGSDPSAANEATRKSYVDAGDATAVKLTGNQTVAGNKTFSGDVAIGGIGQVQFVRRTSDRSIASNITPANDDVLFLSVAANALYVVECVMNWTTGGGGMRIDWAAPAGATMVWTDNDGKGNLDLGTDSTFNATTGTTLQGLLVMSSTAGTLNLRWSQNTSNAAGTVLKSGVYLMATRVG